jgi:hypothetical protein
MMIAVVVGALLAWRAGGLEFWPIAILLVLWPAMGGHWLEVAYLYGVRPYLPAARVVQVAVRFAIWFVGGVALAQCMRLTAIVLIGPGPRHGPVWWLGGVAFIGIELVAHGVLWLRGRPSFYDGRG